VVPALTGYYPAWLDNLADDATVEGSLLDGAVRGADFKKAKQAFPCSNTVANIP
jgi:hypothetical protein